MLTFLLIYLSGCSRGSGLQKDVAEVADAMCKITGVMNKLKEADPNDSAAVARLQEEELRLESEMTKINEAFREKYKERLADDEFRKEYSREIRKAILECPYLSKEDRERFEKEVD